MAVADDAYAGLGAKEVLAIVVGSLVASGIAAKLFFMAGIWGKP